MQQPIPMRFALHAALIVLTVAALSIALPFAAHEIAAATPTPEAQTAGTPTPTPTPRPTHTPSPSPVPPVVLTPLPSLNDLRYYTPVAEPPATEAAVVEATVTTPPPPSRTTAPSAPPRAPVRANTRTEPTVEPTDEPTEVPTEAPAIEPTRKPAAPLPTAPSRSTRLPPAPVSNAQPPINLTPAGIAAGGPATRKMPIASNTLVVVGISLLAAGGSWGFYYLLRESD